MVSATMGETVGVTRRRTFWVRSRAWVGILIIAPFAIVAVLSPPLAPEGSWLDNGFDLVGWALFMVGAGFRWWATLYIGGRKLDTVVAEGPYSVCRNPLYVGTFLMGLGIAFFLQSITFAVGFGISATFYFGVTVPAEEILLRDKFGLTFVDYCRKVPRFWLRMRLLHTSQQIAVSTRGLKVRRNAPHGPLDVAARVMRSGDAFADRKLVAALVEFAVSRQWAGCGTGV